jgi:orotidine-5'-phosphate decarboxylase
MNELQEKIIIALDYDNFEDTKKCIDQLESAVFFKVGLQAFVEFGHEAINYLHSKNKKLFLDLKFKDIPNTVYGAVKSSLKYQPDFLTIHAGGGAEMIKQALEAAKERPNLTILGVTVLTSLSEKDLEETGIFLTTEAAVLKLCELGLKNGLKAFVCSPLEIEPIKKRFGKDVILVTPGIRPQWSVKGDQKRVFTPEMAVKAGSNYLVIGRPITQHENPNEAFNQILQDINR